MSCNQRVIVTCARGNVKLKSKVKKQDLHSFFPEPALLRQWPSSQEAAAAMDEEPQAPSC